VKPSLVKNLTKRKWNNILNLKEFLWRNKTKPRIVIKSLLVKKNKTQVSNSKLRLVSSRMLALKGNFVR